MATIGLDKLYFADITEGDDGTETYGTPELLAPTIKASLTVEIAEAMLYADDGVYRSNKEFKSGKISLNVAELGASKAAVLLGSKVDKNGVLISSSEDAPPCVAIGFRAKNDIGGYRYTWLYRVQFASPSKEYETRGENINYTTPTIEGTIMRRHKADASGNHPWHAEVNEKDTGVAAATVSSWFESVYEPEYTGET